MNQERPATEDIPGSDGIEVMPMPDEDENEGVEDNETDDDEESAGGLPAL